MIDPKHAPEYVILAKRLAEAGVPFMCLNVPAPFCQPFKTMPASANDYYHD